MCKSCGNPCASVKFFGDFTHPAWAEVLCTECESSHRKALVWRAVRALRRGAGVFVRYDERGAPFLIEA